MTQDNAEAQFKVLTITSLGAAPLSESSSDWAPWRSSCGKALPAWCAHSSHFSSCEHECAFPRQRPRLACFPVWTPTLLSVSVALCQQKAEGSTSSRFPASLCLLPRKSALLRQAWPVQQAHLGFPRGRASPGQAHVHWELSSQASTVAGKKSQAEDARESRPRADEGEQFRELWGKAGWTT